MKPLHSTLTRIGDSSARSHHGWRPGCLLRLRRLGPRPSQVGDPIWKDNGIGLAAQKQGAERQAGLRWQTTWVASASSDITRAAASRSSLIFTSSTCLSVRSQSSLRSSGHQKPHNGLKQADRQKTGLDSLKSSQAHAFGFEIEGVRTLVFGFQGYSRSRFAFNYQN